MNIQSGIRTAKRWALPAALLFALTALAACNSSDTTINDPGNPQPDIPAYGPVLQLGAPDSLTGGVGGGTPLVQEGFSETRASHRGSTNCNYLGHGSGDPFLNGRRMTRFLVGAVASWSCVGNNVMGAVDILAFYGLLVPNGSPLASSNPKPGDPNWVTLTDNGTTKEVRLFWGAPTAGTEGFYMAWSEAGGITTGTLILDVVNFATIVNTATDPEFMRMDFTISPTNRTSEMFLSFFFVNPYADSFRIRVDKDLLGDNPKWVAQGRLDLHSQFNPGFPAPPPFPQLDMYTVANSVGHGAALALMTNVGLPLDLLQGDHLGNYLLGKNDRYFFNAIGAPEFVQKTWSSAEYVGGKVITNDAFYPYLDSNIDVTLAMPAGTYTNCTPGTPTGIPSPTCLTFIQSLFNYAAWAPDVTIGVTPPADWRSAEISNAEANPGAYFLGDTCPNNVGGCTWDDLTNGVFEMTYPPNF